MAIEQITKCDLVIPYKQWALNLSPMFDRIPGVGGMWKKYAQNEFENLKAIEVWARRFRKECVGGGVTICGTTFSEVVFGEDILQGDYTTSITLAESATIKVDISCRVIGKSNVIIQPSVDGLTISGPESEQQATQNEFGANLPMTVPLTYVTTLAAGTHNIGFFMFGSSSDDGSQTLEASMTWVIGPDTGCSNVSFGGSG